jgi:rhodanese-related sulfurtransferase
MAQGLPQSGEHARACSSVKRPWSAGLVCINLGNQLQMTVTADNLTIAEMLDAARRDLVRLTPQEALEAQRNGAVLVDIRPVRNRDSEGQIAGAIHIHRNDLEWRLDPASPKRLAWASHDAHVIVFCNEGFASSLAAASLRSLGLRRATDLIGGYRGWYDAGLPTV